MSEEGRITDGREDADRSELVLARAEHGRLEVEDSRQLPAAAALLDEGVVAAYLGV